MPEEMQKPGSRNRSGLLDSLRGLIVIHMVLFHAMYDLVFIFGMQAHWFHGIGARIWQQAICCTFITLSGFCAALGKHTVRRGLIVFGIGAAVTLVTLLFMPEELIVFGVLTLIGSCMLLTGTLKSVLLKIPPAVGLAVSFALFGFTRSTAEGGLGIFFHKLIALPGWLYHDYLTAYFGFPQPGFYSSDYFPLIPWLFLFLSGFFLYGLCGKQLLALPWKGIRGLNFIGRHALEIYVVHQPVIYGLLLAWNAWLRPLF